MQLTFLQTDMPMRAIRGVAAGLVLAGCCGLAAAAAAPVPFKGGFRPDLHRVARVSCPQGGVLPRTLIDAAACGDVSRVRARLHDGADVAATDSRAMLAGRTALHHAVQHADASMVEYLLAAGANPNAADAQGDTPLHLLAMRARSASEIAIGQALLAAGADGRLRNARGKTPLGELLSFVWESIDPLRISPMPLAILLDEAEAKGPTSVVRTASSATPAQPGGATPVPETVQSSPVVAQTETTRTGDAGGEKSVREALAAWANAWSARDIERYLGHYASGFKPADGKGIDAWRAQRRERLGAAHSIEVKLSALSITVEGTRAVAKFRQEYRSDRVRSVDDKTVVWVADANTWRIVEERTGK